jgi:uncharacterized protein
MLWPSGKWVKNWVDRSMPTQEGLRENRLLRPFADRILRSELWRFTQRSVPRGVALGMLAGFLIPVGQIFVAAFLALPVRANVPIATLVTFITNPFTYPFWVVAANRLGSLILRVDALTPTRALNEGLASPAWLWWSWFVREAGVTAFGFAVIGILSAAIGYLVAAFGWRWWVAHKWSVRRAERRERTRLADEIAD